eukprot:TRINITY_DN617_c1_g1_i1.p1 TRINITY_DN617_c1_g1~~TRINITY_DN617_c1_g1_i1.p1  ORF type:complete len:165 (+),score=19.29 TRINITY_DN617_c1_g1_i1:118-612(+)
MLQHPDFPPIVRKRGPYMTPIGVSEDLISDVEEISSERDCVSARLLPDITRLCPSLLLSTVDKFTFGNNDLLFGILPADDCRVVFTKNTLLVWCPTPAHQKVIKPYVNAIPILSKTFSSRYHSAVKITEISQFKEYYATESCASAIPPTASLSSKSSSRSTATV